MINPTISDMTDAIAIGIANIRKLDASYAMVRVCAIGFVPPKRVDHSLSKKTSSVTEFMPAVSLLPCVEQSTAPRILPTTSLHEQLSRRRSPSIISLPPKGTNKTTLPKTQMTTIGWHR